MVGASAADIVAAVPAGTPMSSRSGRNHGAASLSLAWANAEWPRGEGTEAPCPKECVSVGHAMQEYPVKSPVHDIMNYIHARRFNAKYTGAFRKSGFNPAFTLDTEARGLLPFYAAIANSCAGAFARSRVPAPAPRRSARGPGPRLAAVPRDVVKNLLSRNRSVRDPLTQHRTTPSRPG